MGEELTLFRAEFNHSIRIESRSERLSSELGAIILRDVMERLRLGEWLEERLQDPRNPKLITHPQIELLRTSVLLLAQGWHDQDDADPLREDSVLRLAVSNRRGVSPLDARPRPEGAPADRNPSDPEGLPSQPTLSRLVRTLAEEPNRAVLRSALLEVASRRVKAMRGGHRQRNVTLDIDSFPIEVHGHQLGSEHNGHYHARIFHPLVATVAELGDLLDVRLRPGNAHTADGALEFILPLLDQVEEKLCQVAAVRIDAGFPEEKLMATLEKRDTPYVARIKNNAALDRMAQPYLTRPVGRPPDEPRTWTVETTYKAKEWSRERRVVLVIQEKPDELLLHYFWLLTSWTAEEKDADTLLETYRQRGTAEGHFGELVNVLHPALSSVSRQKTHYRGETPKKRYAAANSYHINEALLLLNALAYNVAHTARVLMEVATHEGWSLQRLRERVLRVPGRMLLHGRRATLVLGHTSATLWAALLSQLARLHYAGT
jgi:hypothetical protein